MRLCVGMRYIPNKSFLSEGVGKWMDEWMNGGTVAVS